MTTKPWQALGMMVLIGVPFAGARAATVTGTSAAEVMVLCNRYDPPCQAQNYNCAYVAICSGLYLQWVDVGDNAGTLTENVTIQGMGGNDVIVTATGSAEDPYECGSLTCYDEVTIGSYTVALDGGADNDYLWSRNESGLVTFDGGPGNDWLQHAGDFAGNVLSGGAGEDIIVDNGSGLGGDYLYGGDHNDCLEAQCIRVMDCGGHTTGDDYAWAGVLVCCPGQEECETPTNCETPDECI